MPGSTGQRNRAQEWWRIGSGKQYIEAVRSSGGIEHDAAAQDEEVSMADDDNVRYADHPKEKEADRYRKAAEDALQQLDWTIGYLHGIRKTEISAVLARNRAYIRSNLMDREEQPLPSQKTGER